MLNTTKNALRILVWNPKGGVGKSAFSMAAALETGSFMITNDLHSPIDKVLPEGRALRLKSDQPLPDVPSHIPLIYDFGGYAEKRVIDAAHQAKVVIVPVIFGSAFDMQVSIQGIKEIAQFNPNIIIVANKCEKGDFERIKSVLNEFYNYPILALKKSTAFAKCLETRQSISEMIVDNAFLGYHYQHPLCQVKHILAIANQSTKDAGVVA